ncbi:MAG: hypothetical protein Q9M89_06245 [Persephonella sp.]|nr:hypothetical protein [Persephonella sp.]
MVQPHGGKLVNRMASEEEKNFYLSQNLKKVFIEKDEALDAEKIAIGSFSPLEGFMTEKELLSVCREMKLPSGHIWSIPIIIQIDDISQIKNEEKVLLVDKTDNKPIAVLNVEDIYRLNKKEIANTVFGTLDENHPGVKRVYQKR